MYKYGMIEREFGVGCQPKGFVKFEYSDKNKTGYYSYGVCQEKCVFNIL